MSDFIARMFALDVNGMCLVVLICGWGFLIMRAMMPIAGLAIASFPLMILGALVSQVLLSDAFFVRALERGPGLALTTGIGMTVTFVLIVAAVRIAMMLNDAFGNQPELLRSPDRK